MEPQGERKEGIEQGPTNKTRHAIRTYTQLLYSLGTRA